MRYSALDIFYGSLKTCLLLVFLEIFTTAFLPSIGITGFKPAFSVLIVLFLAFKFDNPFLPFLIFITQYVHSIFSIEGWAIGTLAGIIVSLSLRFLKDLLDLSTAISTIIVVQIFQLAWFLMISLMLSIKLGTFASFFGIFWQFVPESVLMSIASPIFFALLDKIWKTNNSSSNGVSI
jgi:hypothetical protein